MSMRTPNHRVMCLSSNQPTRLSFFIVHRPIVVTINELRAQQHKNNKPISITMKSTTLTTFWLPTATIGFGPQPLLFHHRSTSTSALFAEPVGVFFGTSTGSTESAAEILAAQLGAPDPIDIDLVGAGNLAAEFAKYDALVVGTPTWNTGADTGKRRQK